MAQMFKVYDISLASNDSTDKDILIGTFYEVYEMQDFIENYIREAVVDDDYCYSEEDAEVYLQKNISIQEYISED